MNILITGGAGYLGSILSPLLVGKVSSLVVVDNFMYGQQPFSGEFYRRRNVKVIRGDVTDVFLMKSLISKADVIIPLAAIVGAPACDQNKRAAELVNFEAVKTIVRNASPHQRIIIPSTNSGYGIGEEGKFCTEDNPLRPVSLYGKTKVDAERVVMDRENSVSFRFATLFGVSPRMRLDLLVNDFVRRAVVDGSLTLFEPKFRRNFLHVVDAAHTFEYCLFDDQDVWGVFKGGIFNVGLSGANLTKEELCIRIQNHLPKFIWSIGSGVEDPDKRDYVVSNEKIESLGWRPMITLDVGIRELIGCFRVWSGKDHVNAR